MEIFTVSNFTVLVAAFVGYVCVYRWILHGKREGPLVWPIVGNVPDLLINLDRIYDWMWDYHRKFPTYSFMIMGDKASITSYPKDIEHIMKVNFENYPKGHQVNCLVKDFLGEGIFATDGEQWKAQRKAASFEFASRVLRDYSTVSFREEAVRLLSHLQRAAENGRSVELQGLFMRMTFETICKTGFGMNLGSLDPSLPAIAFADSFDAATAISSWRFWDGTWRLKRLFSVGSEYQLKRAVKAIDKFADKVIENRKLEMKTNSASVERKADLLSRFIALSKDNPKLVDSSNAFLRDVVLNFMIAGRDTTAVTLSWCVYEVLTHPEVEEKLVKELADFETALPDPPSYLDEVGNDVQNATRFARALNFDNLGNLHYLHATISETLRLHPAVPMNIKTVIHDDVLPSGMKVKRGEMVAFSTYAMGRLEHVWGSDCLEFKPERWLKDGLFQSESSFKFLTFNAGPRLCLGKDSAYLQMKLTMAIILRFVSMKLIPGHKVNYRTALVLQMDKAGLPITVRKRELTNKVSQPTA